VYHRTDKESAMPTPTALCRTAIVACLALPVSGALAADCAVQSPQHTIALVELYTSEGCSSCPPADRWLMELSSRFAAERLIALSMHVDYWDDIGWQDRFAQPLFSARQRWLGQFSSSRTIYTPEVFAGMKEIRGWSNRDLFENRVQAINELPARAHIELSMRTTSAETASADIVAGFALAKGERPGRPLEGIVVLYEKKLSTAVRAGENNGVTLVHDNVVRYWSSPIALDAGTGQARWRQSIPLPADWKRQDLGVAAFVQDAQAGEVLQAVSMPASVPMSMPGCI
jgi:hypothetical protein